MREVYTYTQSILMQCAIIWTSSFGHGTSPGQIKLTLEPRISVSGVTVAIDNSYLQVIVSLTHNKTEPIN